ncbi:MAG: phosphoglycerate mutase [Flavobacteriales bacterium]|jgi:broad specificity phosphatase PhoE|nr:MAG: phosphoglycerate mutase [Flavobacteriales bacterium]
MRWWFPYSFLVFAWIMGCSAAREVGAVSERTTVYVVRHAEKASNDLDAPLSPSGVVRADALAERLSDAGVQRVYASEVQRTQRTVAPLAERNGLSVEVVPALAIDDLVGRILREDRGRVVLVAGHDHTVPAIVQKLSGQAVEAIPAQVFDRLYKVVITADGTAEVTVSQYGAITP